MTLGIIGTAGRGPDGDALTPAHWRMMRCIAETVVTILQPGTLVSGGAAVSDHLAVQLYLAGMAPNLSLHLPAEWTTFGFRETSSKYDCGRTSNYYHQRFSAAHGFDSLDEINAAIEKGARLTTGAGGFKERNTVIAQEADQLLAFTFAPAGQRDPKDGGTRDTWDKWLRKHVGGAGRHPQSVGLHFNLTDRRLYRV